MSNLGSMTGLFFCSALSSRIIFFCTHKCSSDPPHRSNSKARRVQSTGDHITLWGFRRGSHQASFYMHVDSTKDGVVEWGVDRRKMFKPALCDFLWSGKVSTFVLALRLDHNLQFFLDTLKRRSRVRCVNPTAQATATQISASAITLTTDCPAPLI